MFSIVNKEVEWDYLGYTTSKCSLGDIINQIKLQKQSCECLYPPNIEEEGKDQLVESKKVIILHQNENANIPLLVEENYILVNVKKNIKRIDSAIEQQKSIKEYLLNIHHITITWDIYVVNGEANEKTLENKAFIETFKEKQNENVALLWLNYADASQSVDQSLKEMVKIRDDINGKLAKVNEGMTEMKAEVKAEVKAGMTEVKAGMTEFTGKITEEIDKMKNLMNQFLIENKHPNKYFKINKCFTW